MSDDAADAEAAFAAVADELRVRILRALWDADGPLSFSELRDRVEVRDSGRFNYHLGELRGRFVESGEDGYELRYAGRRLVGALYSGVYTDDVSLGPEPVAGSCSHCGGDLEAVYADERGRVDCTDCDVTVVSSGIPPAFVDGREDDLAGAIDGFVRSTQRKFAAGYCSACSGPTSGRLEDSEFGPRAVFECDRCGNAFHGLAGSAVLDHTEVVAFYRDHGRDVREVPLWNLDWLASGEWLDAPAEAAHPRAEVAVELDGDELHLTVDESLAVVDVDRA